MTTIQALQPNERLRVYDLVREAGLDVSDWSNYSRPEYPETNPKYCYDWSFIGPDCVVVCLWFGEMQQDTDGIFQHLNYAEIPAHRPNLSSVQKKRRWSMDRTFRTAYTKNLPVRVIIVDGPVNAEGDSKVKGRSLDSEPWHIASYDDDAGQCRLQRGSRLDASEGIPDDDTFNDLAGLDLALLGRDEGKRFQQTVSGVKRDPTVRREVLERCGRTCERPDCDETRTYPGFLDVHHILGAEKSDRVWTCVALCPNCHREAHFSPERDQLNAKLLAYAREFHPPKSA